MKKSVFFLLVLLSLYRTLADEQLLISDFGDSELYSVSYSDEQFNALSSPISSGDDESQIESSPLSLESGNTDINKVTNLENMQTINDVVITISSIIAISIIKLIRR